MFSEELILYRPASDDKYQWFILVYGEPDDWDLDITGEVRAIRDLGFPPPIVLWEPTPQQLFELPSKSPIILVSHTSDESFVNDPDDR